MEGQPNANRSIAPPSYIIGADPGTSGGGTYTGVNQGPSIEDYESVFGPAARDIKQDPERNRRRQRLHLPDALKGANPWLTDRIDGLITDTSNSPFTSIILPYKHIENVDGKIKWNVWSFDEGMASRVPYESSARVLTQTKRSYAGYTVRQGLAISMEANFMMSPAGRENFKNQLTQVVGSIQYTNDLDVHVALVQAPSYQRTMNEKYFSSGKTQQQLIREYVDLFGFLQKNPNGLDIAIEEAKDILRTWGSKEPNFLLCNSKLTMQLTMTPERTQYFTQGYDGVKRLKQGPSIGSYRGINIIHSKAFSIETGARPRDLLERRVRVAEYYRIPWHKDNPTRTYEFYDESKDSWFQMKYDDLVRAARLDSDDYRFPGGSDDENIDPYGRGTELNDIITYLEAEVPKEEMRVVVVKPVTIQRGNDDTSKMELSRAVSTISGSDVETEAIRLPNTSYHSSLWDRQVVFPKKSDIARTCWLFSLGHISDKRYIDEPRRLLERLTPPPPPAGVFFNESSNQFVTRHPGPLGLAHGGYSTQHETPALKMTDLARGFVFMSTAPLNSAVVCFLDTACPNSNGKQSLHAYNLFGEQHFSGSGEKMTMGAQKYGSRKRNKGGQSDTNTGGKGGEGDGDKKQADGDKKQDMGEEEEGNNGEISMLLVYFISLHCVNKCMASYLNSLVTMAFKKKLLKLFELVMDDKAADFYDGDGDDKYNLIDEENVSPFQQNAFLRALYKVDKGCEKCPFEMFVFVLAMRLYSDNFWIIFHLFLENPDMEEWFQYKNIEETAGQRSVGEHELVIVRPNIEHNMLGVILGRGGLDDLGATLWGQTQLECYSDSMHGLWGMSYKYNERAIVFNEKNLIRLWDVCYGSYSGGKDSTVVSWTEEGTRHWTEATNATGEPYQGPSMAVMSFPVQSDDIDWVRNWPSPVSFHSSSGGKLPCDPDNLLSVNDTDMFPMWSATYKERFLKYQAKMPDFTQLHLCNKTAGECTQENLSSTQNAIAFLGSMRVLNENGGIISEVSGCGHHGPDYVGVASRRNGKGMATGMSAGRAAMGVFGLG